MYNPFHDESGNEIDLHKVSFGVLSLLSKVEKDYLNEY